MTCSDQEPSAPFVVTGRRRNGTVTYFCRDAAWALRKLADFDRAGYDHIAARAPDGKPIGHEALAKLAKAAGPAAIEAVPG